VIPFVGSPPDCQLQDADRSENVRRALVHDAYLRLVKSIDAPAVWREGRHELAETAMEDAGEQRPSRGSLAHFF
jgi:hypothetical protein